MRVRNHLFIELQRLEPLARARLPQQAPAQRPPQPPQAQAQPVRRAERAVLVQPARVRVATSA